METPMDILMFAFAMVPLWLIWAEGAMTFEGQPVLLGLYSVLTLALAILIGMKAIFTYVMGLISLFILFAALVAFLLEWIFMNISTSLITIPLLA